MIEDIGINSGQEIVDIQHDWVYADTITLCFKDEVVGLVSSVKILCIQDSAAADSIDYDGQMLSQARVSGPLLVKASVLSSMMSSRNEPFLAFNDSDGGISAVVSPDAGERWNLFRGVATKEGDDPIRDPYCICRHEGNTGYMFFRYLDRLWVTQLDFSTFVGEDSFKKSTDAPGESLAGVRNSRAYLCAGRIDSDIVEYCRKTTGVLNKKANRFYFENGWYPGNTFSDHYYSVTIADNGVLRLWYLDGKGKLQCSYSTDSGTTWVS